MDAYKMLRSMVLTKRLTQTVLRAVRVRLEAILAEREKSYLHWEANIKPKLNRTRQRDLRRRHLKMIQSLKIVIHELTPIFERDQDEPPMILKKQ